MPLPGDISGTEKELKDLQALKEKADEFTKSLADLAKIPAEYAQAEKDRAQALVDGLRQKKQAIEDAGAADILKLQEEIQLTGVVDEAERSRISNMFELRRLREEMQSDGYSEDQIKEAQAIARAEQGRRVELEKILSVKKQIAQAGDLEKSLQAELEGLRRNGAPMMAYEETLRKINQDLKDIGSCGVTVLQTCGVRANWSPAHAGGSDRRPTLSSSWASPILLRVLPQRPQDWLTVNLRRIAYFV